MVNGRCRRENKCGLGGESMGEQVVIKRGVCHRGVGGVANNVEGRKATYSPKVASRNTKLPSGGTVVLESHAALKLYMEIRWGDSPKLLHIENS